MSNMSYCRFQNTVSDLRDCVEAIAYNPPTSAEEIAAAKRMAKLCEEFLENFDADALEVDEDTDEDEDE